MWLWNRHGKSGTDEAIMNREKARIRPEYPGPGAPIREKPVPIRGPLKGLLGKALPSSETLLSLFSWALGISFGVASKIGFGQENLQLCWTFLESKWAKPQGRSKQPVWASWKCQVPSFESSPYLNAFGNNFEGWFVFSSQTSPNFWEIALFLRNI